VTDFSHGSAGRATLPLIGRAAVSSSARGTPLHCQRLPRTDRPSRPRFGPDNGRKNSPRWHATSSSAACYHEVRRSLHTPASWRSRYGLDWTNFFIADVQTGFGTFVAFYLAETKPAKYED
jgi:hypothetical protein